MARTGVESCDTDAATGILILIDVDYFKNLNDIYGHPAGDDCLIKIAEALRKAIPRKTDKIARYGGEEFAIILPDTNQTGAELVATKLQAAISSLRIPHNTPIGDHATISMGFSVYQFPQAGSPSALVEAADRALYIAKQKGRNRFEFSDLHL